MQTDFIAVDAGNTRIKIGCFQSGLLKSVFYWNINEVLPDVFAPVAVLASVAALENEILQQLKPLASNWMVFNEKTVLPYPSEYLWSQMGSDRKLSIFAAMKTFPNQPFLLVSLGTCLTIDWVDQTGLHRGGSISPGWSMRIHAMHDYTQRLPLAAMKTSSFPALDTQQAMQTGAQEGMVAEILYHLKKTQQKDVKTRLLLSGGDAPIFVPLMNGLAQEFPNAVLEGLFYYHQL